MFMNNCIVFIYISCEDDCVYIFYMSSVRIDVFVDMVYEYIKCYFCMVVVFFFFCNDVM